MTTLARTGPRLLAARRAYFAKLLKELRITDPGPADKVAIDAMARCVAQIADVEAELARRGACRACGRPLSDPESVSRGVGPDCAARGRS